MKYAFVDSRIKDIEKFNLEKLDCKVICCPTTNLVYEAICGHPDILMHILNSKDILIHKDMDPSFEVLIKELGFNVIYSSCHLKNSYPGDIILNAINTTTLFLHKLSSTDKTLLKFVEGKKKLNIKQGYSKCSTVILNDNLFITSDKNICETLVNEKKEVLLLPPGDIKLPGLNYGFIGGTCGMIDPHTIVFYGNLKHYKFSPLLLNFLYKNDIKPIFLSDEPLIDRGSIFFVNSPL